MVDCLYRKEAIKAAKDLGYGKKIVDKINKATSDSEILKIMETARHKKFKKYDIKPKEVKFECWRY